MTAFLDVTLVLLNLIAYAYRVFQPAQPVTRVAMRLVVAVRQVMRQSCDNIMLGEQQWMDDLRRAVAQVVDSHDHVGRLGALNVARRNRGAEAVRQH